MSDTWVIRDKVFTKYLTADDIQSAIRTIASKINQELDGQVPVFIVVLNGAFIFASDLIKKVKIDCEIAFVKLSSYSGMESTGTIKEVIGLDISLKGRTVVVIEDIVDTGLTLHGFLKQINDMEPAAVKVAACLLKPDAFRMKFPIDYLCFSIPNEFVVGYGLDYDGLGRNSSDIYKILNG
ncbi:MAG: hypoxanthine phosphoribosyltransferase [Bacteroidales bacterium]|nr:hypoxanthine phosphoribosyltransferase [Bacteroidales bacterium]